MTNSNVVSLKAITPPRWEGEVTTGLLDMYVNGLMNTNRKVGRRLAYELLKAWKAQSLGEARGYGKPTSCGSLQGHKGLGDKL